MEPGVQPLPVGGAHSHLLVARVRPLLLLLSPAPWKIDELPLEDKDEQAERGVGAKQQKQEGLHFLSSTGR